MTTWDRDLYQGRLLPPRQQRQLESLVSKATGQPIGGTTAADPSGYGLGVAQQTSPQTGPFWYYEGQALGARVVHYYFPRSGMIIAVGGQQRHRQRRPERPRRVGLPDPAGSRRSPHRLKLSRNDLVSSLGIEALGADVESGRERKNQCQHALASLYGTIRWILQSARGSGTFRGRRSRWCLGP